MNQIHKITLYVTVKNNVLFCFIGNPSAPIRVSSDIFTCFWNRHISEIIRSKRGTFQKCISCHDDIIKGAVCPWIPRINTDDFRKPWAILEIVFYSVVQRFEFQHDFKCQEMKTLFDLKRQSFSSRNFTETKEKIRLECTPVLDCSRRASTCLWYASINYNVKQSSKQYGKDWRMMFLTRYWILLKILIMQTVKS